MFQNIICFFPLFIISLISLYMIFIHNGILNVLLKFDYNLFLFRYLKILIIIFNCIISWFLEISLLMVNPEVTFYLIDSSNNNNIMPEHTTDKIITKTNYFKWLSVGLLFACVTTISVVVYAHGTPFDLMSVFIPYMVISEGIGAASANVTIVTPPKFLITLVPSKCTSLVISVEEEARLISSLLFLAKAFVLVNNDFSYFQNHWYVLSHNTFRTFEADDLNNELLYLYIFFLQGLLSSAERPIFDKTFFLLLGGLVYPEASLDELLKLYETGYREKFFRFLKYVDNDPELKKKFVALLIILKFHK